MQATIQTNLTLETETCCNCGVTFAMPAQLKYERLTNGGEFYCPNGHGQHYKTPMVVKLKKDLEAAEVALRRAKCETLNERRLLEEATAKHARLQKRVTNGVCPCCNRTFTNLARHMKTKHAAPNEKGQR